MLQSYNRETDTIHQHPNIDVTTLLHMAPPRLANGRFHSRRKRSPHACRDKRPAMLGFGGRRVSGAPRGERRARSLPRARTIRYLHSGGGLSSCACRRIPTPSSGREPGRKIIGRVLRLLHFRLQCATRRLRAAGKGRTVGAMIPTGFSPGSTALRNEGRVRGERGLSLAACTGGFGGQPPPESKKSSIDLWSSAMREMNSSRRSGCRTQSVRYVSIASSALP